MNTVDVSGKLEVTSVAVGVAVVAQRAPERGAGTVVESAQVSQESIEPLKGGVHESHELLIGKVCHSREIVATPYQQLPGLVDNLAATESNGQHPPAALTTIPAESRPSTPAEVLDLPPQARLGLVNRKTVLDSNLFEKICLLLSFGYSNRQAAAYLGISPTTITNIAKRSPELASDFQQARDRNRMVPELTILAEATKNWRAAAWYLTHLANGQRRLSEEEKEELHQERIADQRRATELEQQRLRNFVAEEHAMQDEHEKLRNPPVEPRRKKKVRGE